MSDIGKYYYAARFVTDYGTDTEYVMGDGTLSDGSGINTTIGTDSDLTTSGATVVDDINITNGVITAHSTRTLTLANLGYTGDLNANEYVLPFTDNSSNWNTAYGWGDHSTEGYNPTIGTSTNINTSGFGVIDNIGLTNGVITSMGSRSMLNLSAEDTRAAEKMPEDYLSKAFAVEFTDEFDSLSSWHSGITVKGWEDNYQSWQLIGGSNTGANTSLYFRQGIGSSWGSMNEVWHSGSDGSGSGLDADKLDAQEGTYYLDYNNFTNTPSAYVLPTNLAGDDINIDTGALTGATVISDLDFNITTNTSGLVTDANASIATRTLSLANLGYTGDANANNYVHPTHPGDDISIDTTALTGAVVISDLDFNVTTDTLGHVTDANATVATRTLTLANLGFTGDADATNDVRRTDEEIRDVAAAQWINGSNTTVVYDDAANTIKINAPAGGVVDGSGVENYLVKWTDSDTLTDSIIHETSDRVGINVVQTNATFAVSKTGDETMLFEPNVSNGGRNGLSNFDFSDNSYVGMNYDGLDHEFKTSGVTKLTIGNTTIETPSSIEADSFIKDGGTSSQYLMADGSVSTGGASGIDGSGTVKMIPKFSDSDTLTDSNIYEAASGEVHINTTTEYTGMLNVYQDSTDPALLLIADDAGSSASPLLSMHRDSSSPADDDVLGRTIYAGNDSAGTEVEYAHLDGYIDTATAGTFNTGGIHVQSRFGSTMYSNLKTRGNRSFAENQWYFENTIQAEGGIEINTGGVISLNSTAGTSGEVLVSKGTSSPEWEHRVRSNTSEGGTGSVQIGNIVKITASAHTNLGVGADADTLYIIVG